MKQEFETQVLDIDSDEIKEKLRSLGAKEHSEVLQKRWVFDIGEERWIRLRQVNDKNTITYKNKKGKGVAETEEIEIGVDDFEITAQLLSKLGCFTGQYYQENKRIKFELNDIEFTLDTWPLIPVFLEIEAEA